MAITIKRLPSGFVHIRGVGVTNWTQPPQWLADEEMIRKYAFAQASERFLREVISAAEKERESTGK